MLCFHPKINGDEMAFFLSQQPLFTAQALSSTAIYVVTGIKFAFADRLESLAFRVNKGQSTFGKINIQYAFSFSGSAVNGIYSANSKLVSGSHIDFPNSKNAWNVIAMPNPLTPAIALRFIGRASNPATGVTIDAILFKREQI